MTALEVEEGVKILLANYHAQRQFMSPGDVVAMNLAYRSGLIDLEVTTYKRAIAACLKTYRKIPTVAEIRDAYECEREADRREESKRLLPVTSDSPPNERSSWAAAIAEQLGKELAADRKLRDKPKKVEWSNTRQPDWKTPQNERTEPCGQCACCKNGSACVYVLQLDKKDRKDAERLAALADRFAATRRTS